MQQKKKNTQPEALEGINFRVPASFKKAVDVAIAERRASLRSICTEALAKYLGIPAPVELAKGR